MDYKRDTLDAYLTPERAASYKRFQTKDWSWGRFITALEQRAIAQELSRYDWKPFDQLLDIPCGTGILGKTLYHFPFKILASDISQEMMALARSEYPSDRLVDCIQADITDTRLPRGSFACVVTLGFLHRVPSNIKRATLREIAALTNRIAIISCSIDTPLQRLKHSLLSRFKRRHVPAPCPTSLSEILSECELQGFRIVQTRRILPFLSSHTLIVIEK